MVEQLREDDKAGVEAEGQAAPQEWYVAVDGAVDGPFSVRDLDVKFRTKELQSTAHVWRKGFTGWLKAFEEPLLKALMIDSVNEPLIPDTKEAPQAEIIRRRHSNVSENDSEERQ